MYVGSYRLHKIYAMISEKGTIGLTLNQADMPFTKEGISPDVIINPNAIPSRMTVAQLIECLIGKVAAINGTEADGTSFTMVDAEKIKDDLEKLGYERNGFEYLYNGITGQRMKAQIFIGPTFYQRLKHLVSDKMHSRSRGIYTMLTRQPPEGRSKDGGLRCGEMERDSIISHGMSKFLKERFLDVSDAYSCYVCDICGLFAQRVIKKENKSYPSNSDIYQCISCKNKTKISRIIIPYAFKLLIQELMSMNIAPRIRTVQYEV
jgi:DNA-directed RNA polymerase II subunit RPB2